MFRPMRMSAHKLRRTYGCTLAVLTLHSQSDKVAKQLTKQRLSSPERYNEWMAYGEVNQGTHRTSTLGWQLLSCHAECCGCMVPHAPVAMDGLQA